MLSEFSDFVTFVGKMRKNSILERLLYCIGCLGWSCVFSGILKPVWVEAVELPDQFIDESYISGIRGQVTGFDWTPSGRLFIAEKSGIVSVAVKGDLLDEPFIDIREIVNDRVDRGLLSVAVHPQFPQQAFIYLLYTYDPPELASRGFSGAGAPDGDGNRVARLVRYTADASQDFNRALPDSAKVIMGLNSTFENIGDPNGKYNTDLPSCGPIDNPILDCLPIDELSHTIGSVRFDSQGYLWVTNGDGASYHSIEPMTVMVQDPDSMRGKIFRIDPDTGDGLQGNPYYDGNPKSNRSKVISFGLRNPYSLTIHPQTLEPYVGDVGWDLWEEINGGSAKNFGWPCYSGAEGGSQKRPGFEELPYCQDFYRQNPDVEAPIISWPRNDAGSAIVGDFYFADNFPAAYHGKLFYADFLQGWLRYADLSNADSVIKYDFASDMPALVELKVGRDGYLYYASINTGEIRRIRYTGERTDAVNERPVAIIEASVKSGPAPLSVNFNAASSYDPDGVIAEYDWDFGNGQRSQDAEARVVFQEPGKYTVTLEVRDEKGATDTQSTVISAAEPPVELDFQPIGEVAVFRVGDKAAFKGRVKGSEKLIDPQMFEWSASIIAVAGDAIPFATDSGESFSFTYPEHDDDHRVEVCLGLAITQSDRSKYCETLAVKTSRLYLDTYPTGLSLEYEGSSYRTPYEIKTIVGASRTIEAPERNGPGRFRRWSNSSESRLSVRIGEAAQKFVASYDVDGVASTYTEAFLPGESGCGGADGSAALQDVNPCWSFFWNPRADMIDTDLHERLVFLNGRYRPDSTDSNLYLSKHAAHTGRGVSDGAEFAEYAIAAITVPAPGRYAIVQSMINDKNDLCGDGMDVQVLLNGNTVFSRDIVNGGSADFDTDLEVLGIGDRVFIAAGPKQTTECDTFSWDFALHQQSSAEAGPVFTEAMDSTIILQVGDRPDIVFRATDANGDRLEYTATDMPGGLVIDNQSGKVTGKALTSGVFISTIEVSDGTSRARKEVRWEVKNSDGSLDSVNQSKGSGLSLFTLLFTFLILLFRYLPAVQSLHPTNRRFHQSFL